LFLLILLLPMESAARSAEEDPKGAAVAANVAVARGSGITRARFRGRRGDHSGLTMAPPNNLINKIVAGGQPNKGLLPTR
jgi:hypothetical protein